MMIREDGKEEKRNNKSIHFIIIISGEEERQRDSIEIVAIIEMMMALNRLI